MEGHSVRGQIGTVDVESMLIESADSRQRVRESCRNGMVRWRWPGLAMNPTHATEGLSVPAYVRSDGGGSHLSSESGMIGKLTYVVSLLIAKVAENPEV